MALKDKWINKVDGVDDVLAQDINDIAQGVIELEKDKASNDAWKENIETGRLTVGKANGASTDAQGNVIHSTYATKEEVSGQKVDIAQTAGVSESAVMSQKATTDFVNAEVEKIDTALDAVETQIGDIDTALDAIIAIQNSLIGGDE